VLTNKHARQLLTRPAGPSLRLPLSAELCDLGRHCVDMKGSRNVPHARLVGALGCLIGLALIILIVVLVGWLAQRGIFTPHGGMFTHRGGIATMSQTPTATQK